MYSLHIALQGCLKSGGIDYGVTADTGGHIRYLLELTECSAARSEVDRIDILTRGFNDPRLEDSYSRRVDRLDEKRRIVRLKTTNDGYLSKEDMHQEHEELLRAARLYLRELPRLPDVIHAHYADAGRLAADLKAEFGIPVVFTGHSLGRVKAHASGPSPDLDRRIAIEERAIEAADILIASSRDEAEVQYADYQAYDPGKIRVIPPGGDLDGFSGARSTLAVRRQLRRFLVDPDKPALLAIARPVTKKNLAALVEAFGRNTALREAANLIVVAGTRGDISALEDECADNLRQLLELIDRHDLYGQVAYPKSHSQSDIPSYYAYARETRGLFVNPALNEPFGLTLLEAAAAGLPLVATDSGGPNDIIETCRNGLLVSPEDPDAIGRACLDILSSEEIWEEYSRQGAEAVRLFDWPAHCEEYHALIRSLMSPPVAAPPERPAAMLVCDIDNTLVGSGPAMDDFCRWQQDRRDLMFGIATGRSFHSAQAVLNKANAPNPAFIIASVGAEIFYRRANGATYVRDDEWRTELDRGWDREAIRRLIAEETDLRPQSYLEQRRHKLSYFAVDRPDAASDLRALLSKHGLAATVIRSHDTYLDVLPMSASKGAAVEWVRQRFGLPENCVLAAGDSGNDVEMLRAVPMAIIVANFSDGLAQRSDLGHAYVARQNFAHGIIEGAEFHLSRRA
ncbi:HAD family hydrolase [Pacificimonas flava]|uniref:sucrose-phosphate synthase n=2 Tax=Pacificimonas TaxID=1960290 RepID=A0A219B7I1_9SPHN|nr:MULTISPECIES: HAD-IIB family hydrolase [Pacificimonas]MBZ6378351.1 HAD-IIB family hydrolase [Pacificimonas aurantium]OWV34340.1 HAD family hydrolase [Pacificimonas flava]